MRRRIIGLPLLSACDRVVFVSERDGHAQIYSMTTFGWWPRNLSNNAHTDHFPDVSPDAEHIAFSSLRDGPGENIYIMARDGSGVTPLTSGTGQRVQPRWGANKRIAFQYPAYHGNAQIWTMNSDGTDLRQLTQPGANESDDGGHDFYDAGARLVFSRYDKTTQRRLLYTVSSDGAGTPKRVTTAQDVSETLPVLSHDGTLLAYREFAHATHGDRIRVLDENQPDRSARELCAGRTASLASQAAPCGSCSFFEPGPFDTKVAGDDTFLTQLNDHGNFETVPEGDGFEENCSAGAVTNPEVEAPHSRPAQADGVLNVNLYAAGNADPLVGGDTQTGDCLGRCLARNHAPDAINMQITGVPIEVHSNLPHHWPTVCVTLHTIVHYDAPANQTAACNAFTQPS